VSLLKKLITLTLKSLTYLKILRFYRKKKLTPYQRAIAGIIRKIAEEQGVNPYLAIKVAYCESSLKPDAIRENNDGSIDRGLFQWNNKYHPEIDDYCAFNIRCSTIAFCKAVKRGKIHWWNSSRHCWSKD